MNEVWSIVIDYWSPVFIGFHSFLGWILMSVCVLNFICIALRQQERLYIDCQSCHCMWEAFIHRGKKKTQQVIHSRVTNPALIWWYPLVIRCLEKITFSFFFICYLLEIDLRALGKAWKIYTEWNYTIFFLNCFHFVYHTNYIICSTSFVATHTYWMIER